MEELALMYRGGEAGKMISSWFDILDVFDVRMWLIRGCCYSGED